MFIATAVAMAALTACTPIDGAPAILSDTSVKWLVIGEQHGTRETPEIFADLICLAVQQGRKPVVALELPAAISPAIEAYLVSDGGLAARKALLADEFWQRPAQDGRSSEAMLGLLDRLRRHRQAGLIAAVVPFRPMLQRSPAELERDMAENVRKAGERGDADLTLVLTGNVHARLRPGRGNGPDYLPMASFLPPDSTRSFEAAANGGMQWTCVVVPVAKAGDAPECGAHDRAPARVQRPRGIVLAASEKAGYSGWLNMGVMTTASPPAALPRQQAGRR